MAPNPLGAMGTGNGLAASANESLKAVATDGNQPPRTL
jgi:hypothetical protein